jgi:hypothetical protein
MGIFDFGISIFDLGGRGGGVVWNRSLDRNLYLSLGLEAGGEREEGERERLKERGR